jgi:hypothetical protein
MTLERLIEIMADEESDEFLKFDRVKNKRSSRADLHAFVRMDELVPSPLGGDMVSDAKHDEIMLQVEPSDLAAVATEEVVIELMRCGVRYDSEYESFAMFV